MTTLSRSAVLAVLAAASLVTACASETAETSDDSSEHVATTAAALTTAPSGLTDVALKHATSASSSMVGTSGSAVNGVTDNGDIFATTLLAGQWWAVDLTYDRPIEVVDVFTPVLSQSSMASATLDFLDASGKVVATRSLAGIARSSDFAQRVTLSPAVTARKVRVSTSAFGGVAIAEVKVYARLIPASMYPLVRKPTAADGVCWKKSKGRGAGTIPTSCPAGTEKNGQLCYPTCAPGYTGNGPVCWSQCPSGFTDTGALCQRNVKIISSDNSSCPWYNKCGLGSSCSKCPDGYHNDGCTCRIDAATITKSTYGRGVGSLLECGSGKEEQAGLCYNSCKAGYDGVGPVCWGECGGDYDTRCGATCATSTEACEKFTVTLAADIGQSVVSLAMMAESFGGSAEAISLAADGAIDMSGDEAMSLKNTILGELNDQANGVSQDVLTGAAQMLVGDAQSGQIDWTQLDPTGIATVVMALDQPICK